MRTLLLSLLMAGLAAAQSPGEPFFLLRIIQMDSGPGLDPSPIEPYRQAGSPVDVIGIRSVTGYAQLWLLETHPSFASVEAVDNALAKARATSDQGSRQVPVSLIGMYRPILSHRPEEAVKLISSARYFRVAVYRVRPGSEMEFGSLIRVRRSWLESISSDRPELGYQVVSGSQSGTYIFLSPLSSLSLLDNAVAQARAYGQEDSSRPNSDALLSREQILFRVEPAASYVSDAFAGDNGAFWHPGAEAR